MIIKNRPRRLLETLIDRQSATVFEKKVWKALLRIPRGTVRTYSWVARQIGHPKACRAVGNALNKNRLAPLVPCHRVVGKSGIGGYAQGLDKKRRLLEKEGVYFG